MRAPVGAGGARRAACPPPALRDPNESSAGPAGPADRPGSWVGALQRDFIRGRQWSEGRSKEDSGLGTQEGSHFSAGPGATVPPTLS